MKLTRREINTLIILLITAPILHFIPMKAVNDYEIVWQLFYILPLGIYVITDPERRLN